MNAQATYLNKRRGHGISDEDEPAYIQGFNDALDAILSDEAYYGATKASPGAWKTLYDVVTFLQSPRFSEVFGREENNAL